MSVRRPDVLVVGAGGSGAVLAAGLSRDAGREVLLLEAGPVPRTLSEFPLELLDEGLVPGARPRGPAVRGFPALLTPDTPYTAVRGRFLGGSTTVNGGYFIRARREDFASWAAEAGDVRWSYEEALPLLRALESDLDYGATPLHGDHGPVPVRRTGLRHPASAAFHAAARELGHPEDPDKNAQETPGFGPVPSNTVDGRRINTGIAYVLGVAGRPNLTVLGNRTVRSVVVRRGRATGVVVEHDGRRTVVEAGEIVLCAGSLATPHLLHVSGIGPAGDLAAAGIPVVHDLPAVGATLGDHPQVILEWSPRRPLDDPSGSWLGGVLHLSSPETGDLEILQSLVPLTGLAAGKTAVPGVPLPFLASVQTPRKTGAVRALSADPDVPPRIEYGYLKTDGDRRRLREAVRTTADVVATGAFGEVARGLVEPSAGTLDDDRRLDRWIRARLGTSQHTCGTVPMGLSGAVDAVGRVHGLAGLRVADTSILPTAPRRGPAATAVLIGELIARAIRRE